MSFLGLDYNEKTLGGVVLNLHYEGAGRDGLVQVCNWIGTGDTMGQALASLTCDLAQHPLESIEEAWRKTMLPKEALTPEKIAALQEVQL